MEIPTELMKCKMLMQSDVNLNEPASQSQQPALDLDSQVANLRSLNLIIPDEKQCKDTLDRVSYYRLVKAYGGGLKPHNGIFDGSVTFNDLVALYDFNRKFRQLILTYIEPTKLSSVIGAHLSSATSRPNTRGTAFLSTPSSRL